MRIPFLLAAGVKKNRQGRAENLNRNSHSCSQRGWKALPKARQLRRQRSASVQRHAGMGTSLRSSSNSVSIRDTSEPRLTGPSSWPWISRASSEVTAPSPGLTATRGGGDESFPPVTATLSPHCLSVKGYRPWLPFMLMRPKRISARVGSYFPPPAKLIVYLSMCCVLRERHIAWFPQRKSFKL